MTNDEKRDFIEHFYAEALNTHDLDANDEFWIEDMIWHGPSGLGELHGREAFKQELLAPFFKAFPDYFAINEAYVIEDDLVVARGYFTGTHSDTFVGVPATGKEVRVGFMDIWRIEDGKLAENWVHVDTTGFLRQVGALEVGDTLVH